MAYIPFSAHLSDVYTLTSPSGVAAVFNSPTSPNYVGMISDLTGLDSPDVTESADTKVQEDGGVHGTFFYGRRPITMTVEVFNAATLIERDARLDRARRASMAMRGDSTLSWTPPGGVQMQISVRRTQPYRETGQGWAKQCQIALASADARIFSTATKSVTALATTATTTGSATLEQRGSDDRGPVNLHIVGPVTQPVVTNTVTGQVISFTNAFSIGAGGYVDVDVLNHDALANSPYLDYVGSTWPLMVVGNNSYVLTGTGMTVGTTALTVTGRDSWV